MSSPAIPRRPPASRAARVAPPHPVPASLAPTAAGDMAIPCPSRIAGRFRWERPTGTWWSPEMYVVVGLESGVAQPSTELLVHCHHPDDRTRVLDALTRASTAGRPFALEARIVRPDGSLPTVVVLAEPERDPTGTVTAVDGLLVDVTEGRLDTDRVQALETEVSQMRTAMTSRAAIEQAKGILMLLTSCSDQVAFGLLAHISSHTHRKVRDVAHVITHSAAGRTALLGDGRPMLRPACPRPP